MKNVSPEESTASVEKAAMVFRVRLASRVASKSTVMTWPGQR
jgi:hypothetical protein